MTDGTSRYHGYVIRRTGNTCLNNHRPLYEILDDTGRVVKDATKRPLITTRAGCRQIIDQWE